MEELVVEDAELRSIFATIAKRSAGGRAVSERYNEHDTAQLQFIKSIALPGIRFGKLVPDDDMRVLRLGPKSSLRGADLASMDEWLQRHSGVCSAEHHGHRAHSVTSTAFDTYRRKVRFARLARAAHVQYCTAALTAHACSMSWPVGHAIALCRAALTLTPLCAQDGQNT